MDAVVFALLKKQLATKASLVDGKVSADELPSYVDDVIEYDDLAHFPTTGEKGKIYVAKNTGFTYRWSGSEYIQIGGQDLSNFVTLDAPQTIAGDKRFSNTVYIGNYDNDYISITNGDLSIRATNSLVLRSGNNNVIPYTNNSVDLGGSSNSFKDLYLSNRINLSGINNFIQYSSSNDKIYSNKGLLVNGDIKFQNGSLTDGANSISVADIASSTFNVINASDIVNNTLTQEQYDLITNGKPTLIKGTFFNKLNPIILSGYIGASSYFANMLGIETSAVAYINGFIVNKTTLVCSVQNNNFIINMAGSTVGINGNVDIKGKRLPENPTTNTSPQVLTISANGGVLSWENHMTEWYGTQAEYDALGTYDDNTIYNITEE